MAKFRTDTDTPVTYAIPKIKIPDNRNISNIDITEYSPYLPHGVFISHALDRSRAVAQSDGEQLWNATKTLPQAIGATLIGDAGSLLDFEDMNNQDDEIGSDLKRWSMNYVDKLHEDNPIYRENPGASFDFGDSAYFYEHGRGLAESIGAFMIEGMALGAGVGALFAKGAQAIKFGTVLAKTGNVAKASRLAKVLTGVESGVVQGMSGLTSSVLLNKIESDGAGIGVFDATYKTLIDAGIEETVARKRAADAGEHTILMNRANILLNVSSAMRFIKPINSTNNILKKINWKTNLTGLAVESGQEFLEEEINYLAEQSGLAKGKGKEYGFNEMLDDAMSDKGLESGVLGALGGFMQQGGTQLKDMMSSNKGKIGTLNPETGLYMSNKAYNNMRYDQQETLRVKANKIFSDAGAAPAMESVFRNAKATIENNKILNDLTAQKEQFLKEGKKSEADAISLQIQEKVQEHLAFTAFEHFRAGSTSDLISVFEKVEKGEAPAMAEKDPSSPEFYKTKAKEAITLIKKLENAYIESQSFKNSQSVYARKAFQIIKGTTLESVKKEREIHRIKLQEKLDKVKPGVSVAQIEAASVPGVNPNPNPNATQEEMDERAVLLNNRITLDPLLQTELDRIAKENEEEIKNDTDEILNQKYKDSEKILNDLEKELVNEKFQSRKKGETSLSKEFLDSQNFVKKVQKKIQENIEKEILKRENDKLYPNSSELTIEDSSDVNDLLERKKAIERDLKNTSIENLEGAFINGKRTLVFTIRGKEYFNLYSSADSSLNRDSDGNIVSVTLTNDKNQSVTFSNERMVDEISYVILTDILSQNNTEISDETVVKKIENLEIIVEEESISLEEDLYEVNELIEYLEEEIFKEIKELTSAGFSKKEIKEYIDKSKEKSQIKDLKSAKKKIESKLKLKQNVGKSNKKTSQSSEKSNERNDTKGKKSISSKEIERKDESFTGISEITEVQTLLDLNDEIAKKENEKEEEQVALDLETSRENQISLAEQEKKDDEKFAKDIAKVDSVQQLINILDVEKSVNSLSSERETIIKKRIAVLKRKATMLEKEAKERKEKDKEKERLLLGDENPSESLTDEITTSKDKTLLVNLIAPEGVKPVTTDQTKTSEVKTSNVNDKAVEQSFKEQPKAETQKVEESRGDKADIEKRRQEEVDKIIKSIFPNTQLSQVVYHGTRTQDKFDTFDENKIGELDSGYFGRGFYFSPDKSYAEGYSKQYNGYTITAILNLQNPLETDANKANTNISLENNDGVIVRVGENLNPELNTTEYDTNEIGEVVVKNSNQIHILSEKELSSIKKINDKYDAELAAFESKQSTKKTNKKEEIIEEEDLTYENTPIEIQEDLGGYPTQHGVVQYVDHLDKDFGRTSAVANTDTSIGEYMADYSINKVGVKIKFVAFNYSENRELTKEEIASGDFRKIDVKMVYLNSVGEPLMYNDKPVFGLLLKKLEKDTETESAIALQNRKTLIAMLAQGKEVFTQVTKVSQGKIGYYKNGDSFNPKELFGEGELLIQNNVGELVNSKKSTPNPKGIFFKYNGEDVFIKLKRFNKGVVNFVSPKIMRSNGEPHNLRMNVAKVGQHGFDLLMARLTAQAKGIKPDDNTTASKNMLQNVGISGLTLAQATDLFFYKSNRISKNAINIQYINNKLWVSYNETINGVTEYVTRDFAEELHFSESKNPNANVFNNFKLSIQNMYRSFNIEMAGKTFKELGYEIPFTITNDLGTKTYKPSDTYDSFMFDQGILTTNVQSKVVNGKRIISFNAKTEFNTNPNDWDVKDSVKVEKLKDNDFESFESEINLPESAFEYIENPTLEKLDEETFEPETKITNFFDLIKSLTVFNTESESKEKVLSQSDVDNFTLEDAQNKASELFDTNMYKTIFDDMFIEQKESIFTSTKEQLIKIIKKICL